MQIDIYTDGSCIGNPGPGGWAALILLPDKKVTLKGSQKDTTNNRMEMLAIIKALEALKTKLEIPQEKLQKCKITIYSDSNLIIQTINQNWKRKKNLDLWEKFDAARAWLNIKWQWVKGHHTNEYNNRVDEIAQKEARKIV